MLLDYAEANGFENLKIIVDDGFSGTTDDRKGFQEMIALVEAEKVSTVIVKDMSRFGRNYLLIGNCLEVLFPQHNVRLISVNERMDTKDGVDDFMPFIHIMDEYYSKGLSKKMRAAYKLKSKQGYAVGHAPFGYMPDPKDPKRWVIDHEAAQVVKYIYSMRLDGLGASAISERLRAEKIPIPTVQCAKNGTKKPKNFTERGDYFWSHSVVLKILKNQSYVGDVINFKTYSISHKLKRRIENPEENWEIHQNVHEPIIDREIWEDVQRTFREFRSKCRKPKHAEKSIFAGFLVCSDCGANLNHKHYTNAPQNDSFSCFNNRKSKDLCSYTHHIRIDVLEQAVLQTLNNVVRFARDFEDEFVKFVCSEHYKQQCLEQDRHKKNLQKLEAREKQLDALFEGLVEEKILGNLSEERFRKLSSKYEEEQAELIGYLKLARKAVCDDKENELNVNSFLKMVRKHTRINELTPAVLNHYIHKIVVHHREETKLSKTQRIDIHFNFIGQVNLPDIDELNRYKPSFGRPVPERAKKENHIA